MIRSASANDLGALTSLFRRANDAPYDLSVVTEEKCFGAGIAGAPVTRVFERNGAILGAAVVVFYVLLTPIWLGLRGAAWAAEWRSRRSKAK